MLDPRVNQFLMMVNHLQEAAGVLPRWPKRRVEGPSGGGGPGSTVLVNVTGLDLAVEIHASLVAWCDAVAEEKHVEPLDPWLSSWQQTPSGAWVPTGGHTPEAAAWLRRHAAWIVDQSWYEGEMWPELLELRRRARGLMGLGQPSRRMVDLAVELATSGRSTIEAKEAMRARRADG